MKSLIVVAMLSLVCGCSHNVAEPATPVAKKATLPVCERTPDNFDQAGAMAADGTRLVWNEAEHAWRIMNSEEAKEQYRKAWAATKGTAREAYDAAKKKYDAQK